MLLQMTVIHQGIGVPFGAYTNGNVRLIATSALIGSGVSIFGHSSRRPPDWGCFPR